MTYMDRPDFPQLDAMRAVASIAVVATHTGFWSGVYTDGLLGAGAQRLEVGVAVFFVLSGFLLGRPYIVSALCGTGHDTVRRYFRKRALRILPVYWVSAIAALLLIGTNRSLGFDRWWQTLLLVDLYAAQRLPQGFTQMWSLSVEVAFYLILPLLGAYLVRSAQRVEDPVRRLYSILAALIVFSLAWTAVTHISTADWAPWAARWLPSYLTWFALGLGIAVVHVAASRAGRFTSAVLTLAKDRATCWVGAGALFVLASTPLGGTPLLVAPTPGQALVRHVVYGAIAALVVLPCALGRSDTATAKIMSLPAIRHIGHISYSLFCCHMLVLYLVAPRLGLELFQSSWIVLFAVVLAISLAVSEVLYRFVEMPFLRWKTAKATAPSATATHH